MLCPLLSVAQIRHHVRVMHCRPVSELRMRQIRPHDLGRGRVLLDEIRVLRPPRQRLNPDRPRSRIQIQHPARFNIQ